MLKRFLVALLALMLAVPLQAAEINDFDITDGNNIARWPEGMTFANVNDAARADEGILGRFWKDINGSLSTTGSSNAYAVAANQTLSAYYTGLWIRAKANFTNTGAATMNFDALGAKAVKKLGTVDPVAGDIISGVIYDWIYDGTNIQVSALNGVPDASITTAKLADNSVTTAKIVDGTILWTDLSTTIFNQTPVTPALGDLVPFADVSNGNVRAVATIQSILAITNPTIQRFTSGSGTYTPTAGTRYIRVRMIGGGGGGGAQSTNAGSAGGTSTFGSWSAVGGSGGTAGSVGPVGGTGGTGGGTGTGTLITRVSGSKGGEGTSSHSGSGAFSVYGGAGTDVINIQAGANATANSGAGGGGGANGGANAGGGGGAAEYVEFYVASPGATAYAVGALGAGGAAGGTAGGNGGAGQIIIEEYY